MIKLSVNETKWSILLARTRALILFISIPIFDFGPKKVIGTFQETGPWASLLRAADAFRVTWSERGPVVRLGYVTEMH